MSNVPLPPRDAVFVAMNGGVDAWFARSVCAHAAAVSAVECAPLIEEIEALRQDGSRLTAERDALRERVAVLEQDAARYRWLRDKGAGRQIAYTPSYSIGRGPFIYMTLPALNSANGLQLTGVSADEIIDAALKGEA